jgi:hypothetical protein
MSEIPRLPNGRFPPGVSGGRNGGRKPKATTADELLKEAFDEKVVTTVGNRKRKISKALATATQIANEGATGKQARLSYRELQKPEERGRARTSAPVDLSGNDQAIAAEFIDQLRAIFEKGEPK